MTSLSSLVSVLRRPCLKRHMGREERRQAVLPVPARTALRCLFASAGTYFREYHRTYTQDDAAAVAPWDETRRRVVTFKKKLDVPAVVLKLLGDCACVSVTEHQQLSDLGSDDALLVTSTAWTKGFERFKTTTVYRFTAQAGNSCVLEQTVTCEAPPLGFGLQGQVEKTMCSIAAESLEQQMRCAVEFVSGFSTGGAPSSPLPGEPAVKTRTPRLKSVASMTREEAAALGASPPASLKRSASLKRGRQEEVSPTHYYDALATVEPEAAALADAVSPQVAGGLSRRQSLRRRVASPDAQ